MSWRDRPYAAEDGGGGFGGGGMSFGLPRPTYVVKILLFTNLGLFVLTSLTGGPGGGLVRLGALMLPPQASIFEVWRWVTYQYLHADVIHIFFNMIGLYFLGPPLERLWGPKKFFIFYTFCGVVAGVGFALLQIMTGQSFPLIGASGSVLGCIAACAILFPQMMLILLFFPVPIRVAAVLLAVLYGLTVLADRNLSNAAHLAGMAGAVIWIYGERRGLLANRPRRSRQGAWQQRIQRMQEEERRVDQILDKIRVQGMGSLTWSEKRFLKRASERRRQLDEQQSRRT